jgi:hypothetical protein
MISLKMKFTLTLNSDKFNLKNTFNFNFAYDIAKNEIYFKFDKVTLIIFMIFLIFIKIKKRKLKQQTSKIKKNIKNLKKKIINLQKENLF